MKECNIPFCKEIPDTWKEVPNKYLFEYHSVKVGDKWKDYQLLSLTTGGVKEKDINASGGKVPDNYDKYQTVEPGDMIFCLFDLDVSAVFSGLSHHYGMITSAYEVVKPNYKILDQNFSDFWFQYVFTNRYYKMYSKNIRFTIGSDMFKAIATPIPPMDQQRKIAGFLNRKTEEIDSLIEIENQQIEKLKEYKQSCIDNTISNLNDDVRIKYICNLNGRIGFRGYTQDDLVDEGDGAITISPSNMQNLKMNYEKCHYLSWFKYNESPEIQLENGDILFVKTGSTYGKSSLVVNLPMEATINPQLLIFKKISINNEFFLYALQTSDVRNQIEGYVIGGTIPTISQDKISRIKIKTCSPDMQIKIVEFLNQKSNLIDTLIERKNDKIELLEEYKKSIIYEYVTGKKEVC